MASDSWIFLLLTLCSVGGLAKSFENYDYMDAGLGYEQEYDDFKRPYQHKKPTEELTLRMPSVHPMKHDSYMCMSVPIEDGKAYIVGYTPHADMHTAHHMLMFGCSTPASKAKSWNCGDMGAGICGSGPEKIMYAWGKNAPPLRMPKGVAFKVGQGTVVKHLVLQVHYGKVKKFQDDPKLTDDSGVTVKLTKRRQRYRAGIYLLANGFGAIPPSQTAAHLKMDCAYRGSSAVMHPFAFRVHAHKLGSVISGYRIRTGRDGKKKWTLIGKGDPQRPQAFYPIKDAPEIHPGDELAAQCTYNSLKKSEDTYIGATMKDEMCNFYMMFYYDPSKISGYQSPEDACEPSFLSYQLDFPKDADQPLPGSGEKMEMKRDEVEGDCASSDCVHKRKASGHLKVVNDWPLHSHQNELGQVTGVAMTPDQKRVVIFHRGSRKWEWNTFDGDRYTGAKDEPIQEDTVVEYDPTTGNETKSMGAGKFFLPHGLHIDHEGNYWFTDVAMHQVFKFTPNATHMGGKKLVLGVRFEPGHDDTHFCKPTDVAVDKMGNIFVADGYCNQRVLKFNSKGELIKEYKTKFSENVPTPHSMLIPHSLSLDEENKENKVLYIADREHGRVLASNPENGMITNEFKPADGARIFAVQYSPIDGGVLYMANVADGSSPAPSYTYSLKEEDDKKVMDEWPMQKKHHGFHMPHAITANKDGTNVYVAEIGPNKVWKLQRD